MAVTGGISKSVPQNPGFVLEIQLQTSVGAITLSITSHQTNYDMAREEIRRQLWIMGSDLAQFFDQPGSLK